MYLKPSSQRRFAHQAMAIFACLVLLYVASGAALLHHHKGPETTCSVCQVLHAPALASARLQLIPEARQIARSTSLPERAAPSNSFSLHRTPRAPPSA